MSCQHKNIIGGAGFPADYVRCTDCGTYRSLVADTSIYYDDYWSEKHGHSNLYEQAYNCDLHIENGVSKNKFILDRIASAREAALEIGCAPGRMLYWLKWAARFKKVWGIDPADKMVIDHISSSAADTLIEGMFTPSVVWAGAPCFDYILAADVFEHSTEPVEFLAACARLLKPGGQLFLMLPFADDLPLDSRMFNSVEHAYLHSRANMESMLNDAGIHYLDRRERWTEGHDTITGFKR